MTLEARGRGVDRARERLSYRTLDVEQIGSVYETVMGFTVEQAAGRVLAIKAGKNNRTPIFINLDALLAKSGKDRVKYLKEDGDRALTATQGKAVEAATSIAELVAALDSMVDERASPRKRELPSGTPILQPTDERRRTGSHYTPRSLTEPIVRYALEPALQRLGPNATPEQILDLKVCDPAMGSGAFLVEACRALAAQLVAAWARWPVIPADADEELHARRLVAQRCLYGVDKNPIATDLAKLSLWLATLARDHEFTFLDHALKSGDSLVGLTEAQISAVHWDISKPGLPLFRQLVRQRVAEAMKGRAEIQAAPDDTVRAVQEARHRALDARLKDVRVMGDAIVSAFFSADRPKAREAERTEVESLLSGASEGAWVKLAAVAAALKQGAHPLTPFHWEVEFPEVFMRESGGFDAMVGNPPFAGKNSIGANNRINYLPWIQELHRGAHGNSDLVAHFFRRAFALLRRSGAFGLIATNTIGQGDTRSTGLSFILAKGGNILRAIRRLKWPGEAAVIVSVVVVQKADLIRTPYLDGRQVRRISAYLVEGDFDGSPEHLSANRGKAFIGSIVLGMGFTFDDEAASKGVASPLSEMNRLISKAPNNASRIFPYIGGEEVSSDPRHRHHRYVMDFGNLDEQEARAGWPELMSIVEEKVRPKRATDNRAAYKRYWWRFGERQTTMLKAISNLPIVFVCPRVSPHFMIAALPTGMVYSEQLIIFAFNSFAPFSALHSRVHEVWARFFSSSMKDDLRYAPSDCFRTFPFSAGFESAPELETVGRDYLEHRAAVMIARNEGMTKVYNRFHDCRESAQDIQRLRELHAAADRAALEAYGWTDLAGRADPVFLDESIEDDHTYQGRLFWPSDIRDEVLARLLALNAERHAEEVHLGIAPGMKGNRHGDDVEYEEE